MLDLIILFLILIGLVTHRYLTNFWEQGMLPYAMGFLTFANIFIVIYLVNFVWIFGLVVGVAIFLFTFLQIVYASFLWPFLLPQLISIHKKPTIPKVNPLVYGSWSYIIIGLGLLTMVNFFVSDYASLTKSIVELFGGSYITPIIWIVGIAILSNIIRSFILSKYLKKDGASKKESEMEEVLAILDEAKNKLGTEFDLVREQIEKMINSNTDQFLETVQKGRSVRKYLYSTIANISGDMVESGQYHIYRGVLNPVGPGQGLLKIFDLAMDELVELGDTDKKNAETQKKAIRENIKSVG
ncbi:hypothetical protein KKD03_00635 [Patescibacteria group bacterium]|nr:hypothetical protein [Patescibacteria group bacterium]